MSNVRSTLPDIIGFLAKVLNLLGMAVLVGMMLLTVSDVFLRYFFNSPIMGGTEITEYMMVCLFLGVPLCTLKGGAIKMDLIASKLPRSVQPFLDALTDAIGLSVMICLTWQLFKEMTASRELGIASTVLGIPNYPFQGILAFGVGMLCVVLFVNVVRNLVKGVKRDEP
jgi:TRAP-type C4-dicarboxylate transport system permease small subunit